MNDYLDILYLDELLSPTQLDKFLFLADKMDMDNKELLKKLILEFIDGAEKERGKDLAHYRRKKSGK